MRRTTTETALNRSGFIEDAVTVQEENGEGIKNHPNFIEANTSGITLRELAEKNIIPKHHPDLQRQQPDDFTPEFHRCSSQSGRGSIRRAYTC